MTVKSRVQLTVSPTENNLQNKMQSTAFVAVVGREVKVSKTLADANHGPWRRNLKAPRFLNG